MQRSVGLHILAAGLIALGLAARLSATDTSGGPRSLTIPRVTRAPVLEDFLTMKLGAPMAQQLARVDELVQRSPSDGQPASQRTEAYFGYDDKNLYVVFISFDSEPGKIRARKGRRENILNDDRVQVWIDTFHDQRRAYIFSCNPYGIQFDALWTEGTGPDETFDTVWDSRGARTPEGYVVWMAIPFRSIRFPAAAAQEWGILVRRAVPRASEEDFWPHVSSRVEGYMNQAATVRGIEGISPGRNFQIIPYGSFRSFRALDTRDAERPRFQTQGGELDAGLDAKLVFHDSLVLDLTANPDFSQVESDEPQTTVNQRFEVFFPEKRPFFLENSNFFQTPIDLLFTRRIADPQMGARLTGKLGRFALGLLAIDDQAPGRLVPDNDPRRGRRARVGVVRISRDIGQQSSLGFIATDREFAGSSNRIAGFDGRVKLGQNWTATFQGVTSATRLLEGTRLAGPAYSLHLQRDGLRLYSYLDYTDRSSGFRTDLGFVPRTGVRGTESFTSWRWRPEGKLLIAWGPNFYFNQVWDRGGLRLDGVYEPSLEFNLTGESWVGVFSTRFHERLRPEDFDSLSGNVDFVHANTGVYFGTSFWKPVTLEGSLSSGTEVNFLPPADGAPSLARRQAARLLMTVRPLTPLTIENTYLLRRLRDRATPAAVFNDHIMRTKWNWQFNRELSLRVIMQYTATLANPMLTSLETTKSVDADFLVTYQVNPWTALYVGYNSNAQNLDVLPTAGGSQLIRTGNRFVNNGKQFFVKFSYLLRF